MVVPVASRASSAANAMDFAFLARVTPIQDTTVTSVAKATVDGLQAPKRLCLSLDWSDRILST